MDNLFDLSTRITLSVQQNEIDDRIREIVREVFENELEKENIIHSRSERSRLFRRVMKIVLTDLLAKNENGK